MVKRRFQHQQGEQRNDKPESNVQQQIRPHSSAQEVPHQDTKSGVYTQNHRLGELEAEQDGYIGNRQVAGTVQLTVEQHSSRKVRKIRCNAESFKITRDRRIP